MATQIPIPNVVMILRPVDGGKAVIGMIECPHCGVDHYTTHINSGSLEVFCGKGSPSLRPDGWSTVNVEKIF